MLINSIFLPKTTDEQINSKLNSEKNEVKFSYLFSDLFRTVDDKQEIDDQNVISQADAINEKNIFYSNSLDVTSPKVIQLFGENYNISNKLSSFIFNSSLFVKQSQDFENSSVLREDHKYFSFNKNDFLKEIKSFIDLLNSISNLKDSKIEVTIITGDSQIKITFPVNTDESEQWISEQLKTNHDFELRVNFVSNKSDQDNSLEVNNNGHDVIKLISKSNQYDEKINKTDTTDIKNKEEIILSNNIILLNNNGEELSDDFTDENLEVNLGENSFEEVTKINNFNAELNNQSSNKILLNKSFVEVQSDLNNFDIVNSKNTDKSDVKVIDETESNYKSNKNVNELNELSDIISSKKTNLEKQLSFDQNDFAEVKIDGNEPLFKEDEKVLDPAIKFDDFYSTNAHEIDTLSISTKSDKKLTSSNNNQTNINVKQQALFNILAKDDYNLIDENITNTTKYFSSLTNKNIYAADKTTVDNNSPINQNENNKQVLITQENNTNGNIELVQRKNFSLIPQVELMLDDTSNKEFRKVTSDVNKTESTKKENLLKTEKNVFPDDLIFKEESSKRVWVKLSIDNSNEETNQSLNKNLTTQNRTITLDTNEFKQDGATSSNIYHDPKLSEKNSIDNNLADHNAPLFANQKTNELHNNLNENSAVLNVKPVSFLNDSISKNLTQQNAFVTAQRTAELIDKTKTISSKDMLKEIYKVFESGNKHSVILKIEPRELGAIKIMIDTVDNVLNAKVDVQNETVGNLLRNNLDQLKQNLLQSGIQVNTINISYNNNSDQKQHSFNSQKRKNFGYSRIDKNENITTDFSAKQMGYNTYEYLV